MNFQPYSSFSNILSSPQALNPLTITSLLNKHSPTNNNNNSPKLPPTISPAANNQQNSPLAFKTDPSSLISPSSSSTSQLLSNLLAGSATIPGSSYPLSFGLAQTPVLPNPNPSASGSFLNPAFKPGQPWDLGLNGGSQTFPLLKRKPLDSDINHSSDLLMPKLIKNDPDKSVGSDKLVKSVTAPNGNDGHASYRHRCKFCKKVLFFKKN